MSARRSAVVPVVSFVLLLALPATARAQRNFDDVEIKVTHVAGKVHMLEGAGGNIGVSAGEDGVLLIDDQFEPLAPKIQAAVDKLAAGKVRFVLNTHHHGDHTGGNVVFGKTSTIIAHRNVRKRLASASERGGQAVPATPKAGLDEKWSEWGSGFISTERWIATLYRSFSDSN